MGKDVQFAVSSGLKNIIGKELITNEAVAVFELVKNSYDAYSNNIEIKLDLIKNEIMICDNGIGMDEYDINNKWLFVAYSEKKNSQSNNKYGYVGAKGIGRFACDRLGQITEIYTKKIDEKDYNKLYIDWGKFEDDLNQRFEGIKAYLSKEDSTISSISKETGTVIKISRLHDIWDEKRINRLIVSLSKLVDPFSNEVKLNIKLNIISDNQKLSRLTCTINNNILEVLKDKSVHILAKFTDKIEVQLFDRGKSIYKIERINNTSLLNKVEIKLYYLNKSAKIMFKKHMQVDSVNYGNLFVYRNGFRVYPFGESDFDGFGLDIRKTQGFGRYIGNRELLGAISIYDDKNHYIEVSSRDRGFVENIYTLELKDKYMEFAHKPLEKYVNTIKWGYDQANDYELSYDNVELLNVNEVLPTFFKTNEYNLEMNREVLDKIDLNINKKISVAQDNPNINKNELLDILRQADKAIKQKDNIIKESINDAKSRNKEIEILKNQNELLRKLSSTEKILQTEIIHHISKSSNTLDSSVDNLIDLYDEKNSNYQKIVKEIANIKFVSSKLKVFYEIILKGNFSAKSKINVNLFEYFQFYVENSSSIRNLSRNTKIALWMDTNVTSKGEWLIKADVYDISVIIDNFYSNVIDLGGRYLDIKFTKSDKLRIEFLSDTPHVPEDKFNSIFELGYSTKENGTGIGLYHIKKIVTKNKWGINIKNTDDGVMFIIEIEQMGE